MLSEKLARFGTIGESIFGKIRGHIFIQIQVLFAWVNILLWKMLEMNTGCSWII